MQHKFCSILYKSWRVYCETHKQEKFPAEPTQSCFVIHYLRYCINLYIKKLPRYCRNLPIFVKKFKTVHYIYVTAQLHICILYFFNIHRSKIHGFTDLAWSYICCQRDRQIIIRKMEISLIQLFLLTVFPNLSTDRHAPLYSASLYIRKSDFRLVSVRNSKPLEARTHRERHYLTCPFVWLASPKAYTTSIVPNARLLKGSLCTTRRKQRSEGHAYRIVTNPYHVQSCQREPWRAAVGQDKPFPARYRDYA